MTQILNLDVEAMKREGLIPIRCKNPSCSFGNPVLAAQSGDGCELHFNQNARTRGSSGRVQLTCDCGVTRSWRPSTGPKSPQNHSFTKIP